LLQSSWYSFLTAKNEKVFYKNIVVTSKKLCYDIY